MLRLTRGELVKTGLAGLVVLALADCGRSARPARAPFDDGGYRYRILSASDRTLIAAVAGALLAGALPAAPDAGTGALVQAVRGVDVALAGLPPDVQAEVQQLFSLLEFPVTRALAAGLWSSWSAADTSDVASFLNRWRYSNIALFRSGYQALHQLVMAAWYGNAESWPRIGYPGPPAVA